MEPWVMSEADYRSAIARTARQSGVTPEQVESGIRRTIGHIYAASSPEHIADYAALLGADPSPRRFLSLILRGELTYGIPFFSLLDNK